MPRPGIPRPDPGADPDYAAPHLGLAETFSVLGLWGFLPPRESLGRAKAEASRAIELDDTLVGAHLGLASVLFFHEWDWAGAQRHFHRHVIREACPPPPHPPTQNGTPLPRNSLSLEIAPAEAGGGAPLALDSAIPSRSFWLNMLAKNIADSRGPKSLSAGRSRRVSR